MSPKLTVILPSYNYATYIKEALDSVVHQPYSNLELLIIEDGSQDGSPEIIREYANRYSFIRAIFHSQNRGLFKTLEEGLALSRGEYLHWLSADDLRHKDFFVKTMGALEEHPEFPVCSSDHGYFYAERPEERISARLLHVDKPQYLSAQELPRIMAKSTLWIPGHTAIMRKDAYYRHGGYDHNLDFLCDWFLWHRVALYEGLIYLPETLSFLRLHSRCFSSKTPAARKSIQFRLLKSLSQDKATFRLFKRSTTLHPTIGELFWEILFKKPRYWLLLPLFVRKWISSRVRRICQ